MNITLFNTVVTPFRSFFNITKQGSLTLRVFLLQSILLCVLMSLLFTDMAHAKKSPGLRIAVSSNFAPILKELLVEFTEKTHVRTQVISGATGTLYLQALHGAPFDIFLAADAVRPKALADNNLTVSNSRKTYALGQLAYWSATNTITSITQLTPAPKRFAIANPDIAPYGKAAKQALVNLGLWEDYHSVLVQGININQTFQQVRSQAVDAGFVANSQLVLNNLTGFILPQNSYLPIEQQLVIFKNSQMKSSAAMLSDFLLSAEIQQKIVNYGYQARD